MIKFEENDYNLLKIRHESKLANMATKVDYYIYGLTKTHNNRLIEIKNSCKDDNIETRSNLIISFFNKNGLGIVYSYNEYGENNEIQIGLRKDLRQDVVLCSAILKTIIFALEGRLKLNKKFKLPPIPVFK